MPILANKAPLLTGDFETGNLFGWAEIVTANWDVIQSNNGLSAFEGTYFLQLGDGNDSGVLEQTEDVSISATSIDNNNPLVRITYQEAQSFTGETANIRLEFRDGPGGTVLGSAETGFHEPAGEDTWTEVDVEGNAPTGTREIAVLIQAGSFNGSVNNFSIDKVELSSDEDIFINDIAVVTFAGLEVLVGAGEIAAVTFAGLEVLVEEGTGAGETASSPLLIIVQ